MGEVILTMKGIDKSFPGVHALDHVDLEIRKGEVHALMGENGAGKSTLMKVLTGIYSKDSGTITYEGKDDHVDLEIRKGEVHALMGENGAGKSTLMKVLTGIYSKDSGTITYEGKEITFSNPREAQEVHALMGENGAGKSTLMKVLTGIYSKDSGTITYEGKEITFSNPREAQDAGIVIVHQEPNMMNHLTVAQNIFIGREMMSGKLINDKKMNEEAKKLFTQLNIDIDPTEKMGNLTVGKQQMCEIAKAISHDAKVIIFDEPSAALTKTEIEELFKIIRDLREKQLGIVYISHRMDEIKVITDRVTVMRDGGYVGTLITKESTKDDIINMMVGRVMVGRVIYEDPKTESTVAPDAPVVLKVEHLNAGRMVRDVSFELHKGEILGFSGLMGAGRTETARALFGADPKESGDIYINGEKVDIKNPMDAVKCGIGYLSEDRKRYGIVVGKSVAENTTMATMGEFTKGIFINKKKEKEIAQQYVDF